MKTLLFLGLLTTGGMYYTLKPAVAEHASLQGKWKIAVPPKDWKIAPGTNVVVTDNDIQIRVGPVTGSVFHYSADYSTGEIEARKGGEQLRLGKFSLSGDRLSVAVGKPGGERPASVSSSESGVTTWVFKRAQPAGK